MYRLLVVLLLSISSMVICEARSLPSRQVQVCYLPFDYETFGPVTRDMMEKQKCKEFNSKDTIIKSLYKFIYENVQLYKSENQDFDENRVRLKIYESGKSVIFVDADGVVSIGANNYKLTHTALLSIRRLLGSVFKYED